MVLSAYLVIADTGVYGHTREAIQVSSKQGQGALPFLHALGRIDPAGRRRTIRKRCREDWEKSSASAFTNLKEIGVSSPEADAWWKRFPTWCSRCLR